MKGFAIAVAAAFVVSAAPVFAQAQAPAGAARPAQPAPAAPAPAAQAQPAAQPPAPFPQGAKVGFVNLQAIAQLSADGKAAAAKVDRNKRYLVADAFKLLKEATVATKFDQTIDVAINLGIDPKHADQMVRGAVNLPHGTGKTVRIAVFAKGEKGDKARAEPSLGAALSESRAIRPPAPGLFSTTAPLREYALPANLSPTRRAQMSPALPAGKP